MRIFSLFFAAINAFDPSACFVNEQSFNRWAQNCINDAVLIFTTINPTQNNYMMAKSVQKGLDDQFVKSGLLSYTFSCAVFNEPDQFEIIGEGWKVPITPDIVGRPRAAACVKIAKDSNSSIYKATRWTLMPNFDLCQFREKASTCKVHMQKGLEQACTCGNTAALIMKRGSSTFGTRYFLQYRSRRWDIAAFCTGINC